MTPPRALSAATDARPRIVFIHASPAAVAPVAGFYAAEMPGLVVYNLLDDGLLHLLRGEDSGAVTARLLDLVVGAIRAYRIDAVLLTCSAVDEATLETVRAEAGVPVIKIDAAMARQAVRTGSRLGVVITFAASREATRARLLAEARAAGVDLELREEVVPAAYEALLAGDVARHDAEVLSAVRRLATAGVDAVVLGQVSMARVLAAAEAAVPVPLVSSLRASLGDVQRVLALRDTGSAA